MVAAKWSAVLSICQYEIDQTVNKSSSMKPGTFYDYATESVSAISCRNGKLRSRKKHSYKFELKKRSSEYKIEHWSTYKYEWWTFRNEYKLMTTNWVGKRQQKSKISPEDCWGVTRKIRMIPLTREREFLTHSSTKWEQRDCNSLCRLHKYPKVWIRLHVPSRPLL
jgi:hypothetical protein